jgi:rare lipoprotein A
MLFVAGVFVVSLAIIVLGVTLFFCMDPFRGASETGSVERVTVPMIGGAPEAMTEDGGQEEQAAENTGAQDGTRKDSEKRQRTEVLVSSWYGPGLEGNLTASGEVFDPYYDYTAASLYYPMGTEIEVCYADCAVVRVNDLGPYVGGRDLDLSQAAAEDIGLTAVGTDVVDVRVLE